MLSTLARLFFAALAAVSFAAFSQTYSAGETTTVTRPGNTTAEGVDFLCPDAKIFGSAMISDICWDCMLPISIFGGAIGEGSVPYNANTEGVCWCDFDGDALPFEMPGASVGAFAPARLTELVRKPYCSPVLGGVTLMEGNLLYGDNIKTDKHSQGAGTIYKTYHQIAFPILQILDILDGHTCNPDGFWAIDMIWMGELDPTWVEDELGFILIPEAAVFANPMALLACSIDCMMGAAPAYRYSETSESFFWCAGCWGGVYPLSGNYGLNVDNPMQGSALSAMKSYYALYRRGFARKTVGTEAYCGGVLWPFFPKAAMKQSLFWPVAEAESAHMMGDSYYTWGLGRAVPGLEDQVFMWYRYTDCCISLDEVSSAF